MDEREHEQMRDDISAWVIGALEPAEAAALEDHLHSCESCSRQARWLQPATSALLESVKPVEPPPALRERVMSEVQADVARRRPAKSRSRGGFWDFLAMPATALAAVALLAAGVGGYVVANGDNTQHIDGKPGPHSLVQATLDREGDTGTLELANLSQLGGERVYQAWVQHGSVMEDSSLFAAREDGTATAAIPRADLHGGDAVLVTIEPRGGSTQPTTDPLIEVPID